MIFVHTHTNTNTHISRCQAVTLMPLLPSCPAASWHLSPWRRLIASSVLARGERHTESERPSRCPFICFLQRRPLPPKHTHTHTLQFFFFFLSQSPSFVPFTLSFISPSSPSLSSKTIKMKGGGGI